MLLALCPFAFALSPSLDISQYAHTAWRIQDGTLKARVQAIAQTPDGYLWLGTEFGLLRFDGVRFVSWEPPAGNRLPSSNIRRLLASRDGSLWIATDKGLANWKGASLTRYPELAGQSVSSILEDHEGAVWVGSFRPAVKLCAVRSATVHCFEESEPFGNNVGSLYEDSGGNLWVGAQAGLWRWKPGPPKRYPGPPDGPTDLSQDEEGRLVMATPKGIFQLTQDSVRAYPIPFLGHRPTASSVLRDRDGSLWIGTTDRGLVHVHEGRTDLFGRSDGLSGDFIVRLFEDREGDIWVATLDGLDRFHNLSTPTLSVKQGLSSDAFSVLAIRDGSVWLGTVNGLSYWSRGQITTLRKHNGLPEDSIESLFQDDRGHIWVSTPGGVGRFEQERFIPVRGTFGLFVFSMATNNTGDLWISTSNQGLLRVLGDSTIEHIPWARLRRADFALALQYDRFRGGLWLGFRDGGLLYFKDGQVRASYTEAEGLGGGRVSTLQLDKDGAVWAATQGGLSRIKDGVVATLTSKNGLPCDSVHWSMEDNDHFLWLYTGCGLVRIARRELDAWIANPKRTVQATVLDASDSVTLHSAPLSGYSPTVTKAADGKLWFVSGGGVSVLDPRHLEVNKLPPPVHIEQIVSDRETRWQNLSGAVPSNLRLPALSRDLQIDYTALSLVAPEKIRFKYKLEGYDRDWQDVGNRRQAFYTNLSPKNYHFRVMASNNSGVWNEAGDSLEFSIAPAYYQTNWFRWSSVAALMVLLAGLYQLRLRYLKHEFNVQLEARVGERTRIARDLHDTLLQSFQGVLLKFSAMTYLIPERPDVQKKLEGVIDQARAAVTEGRDAVQGLRSSTVLTNDLARAVTVFGEGLAAERSSDGASDRAGANCPEFRVRVEGKSRELPPLIRDEVYRIAAEALRNAFRHAQAKRIEVEIRYGQRHFRLSVLDNGKGIDQTFLNAGGRAGHHGLPGISERAGLAGGKLTVRSQLDAGTEIELTIPAAVAYAKAPVARGAVGVGRRS